MPGNKLYFDFSATVASGNALAKQDMGTKEGFIVAVRRETSGKAAVSASIKPSASTSAPSTAVMSSSAPAMAMPPSSHSHGGSSTTQGEQQILEKLGNLETLVKLQSSEIMELKAKVTSGGGSGLSDRDREDIRRMVEANSGGCCVIA